MERENQEKQKIGLGDLVRIRERESEFSGKIGVVLDGYEDDDGFHMYELLIGGETEWFHDIVLEAMLENR